MRVLIVAREYPPYVVGGVATHTYRLIKAMRAKCVHVDVISFGYKNHVSEEEYGRTVYIKARSSIIARGNEGLLKDLKIPMDIVRYAESVSKVVKREGYDIVHVEEPYLGGFIVHESKVTTIHDTSYGEIRAICNSRSLTPYLARKIIFYATLGYMEEYASWTTSKAIIVPSPQVRDELVYAYKFRREKIYVVPNGVEEPNPKEPARDEAKRILGLKELIIFTTAQHIPRKRLDVLLKAAALLKSKWCGKAAIIMGGDGPLTSTLKKTAQDLNLQGFVKFTGWIPERLLPIYYRASDIFVVTSEYEAGPQTLLEAGIRGCTLVSSRISFFPALMRGWIDGVLYEPGNYIELAKILDQLLEDDELRRKLSANAVSFASRFTWDKIADYTLSVYRKMGIP